MIKRALEFDKKYEPLINYILTWIFPFLLFVFALQFSLENGFSKNTLVYVGSLILIWVLIDPIYKVSIYDKGQKLKAVKAILSVFATVCLAYASMWF